MSLPDEQIRAQQRAWDLMTGPAKNWTRKNFNDATRHFIHPAQLERLMTESKRMEVCDECKGSGFFWYRRCPKCKGAGVLTGETKEPKR